MTPERAGATIAHLELVVTRVQLTTALSVINGLSGVVDLFVELLEEHAGHVEEVQEELAGNRRGQARIEPIIEKLRARSLSPTDTEAVLDALGLLEIDSPQGLEFYERLEALREGNLDEARRTSDPRQRMSLV